MSLLLILPKNGSRKGNILPDSHTKRGELSAQSYSSTIGILPKNGKRTGTILTVMTRINRDKGGVLCASCPKETGSREDSLRLISPKSWKKGGLYAPHLSPKPGYTRRGVHMGGMYPGIPGGVYT